MRQRNRALLPMIILFFLTWSTAWSQSSPLEEGRERIIFIGALNFDCYPDTVQGLKTEGGYLPKRVVWGAAMPVKAGVSDTACRSITPAHQRVQQTVFVYPGGAVLHGAVAFQHVNPDTLIDIVIHVRQEMKGQGKEKEQDSLRSIVLFGQHSLNTVSVIHVGEIRRFQADPFFAMELVKGSELTRPGKRDFSGATSYELEPISIDVDDRDTTIIPTISPIAGLDYRGGSLGAASVQIYPNPAGNTIMIEAAGLAAGTHVIELISVNGAVEVREEIGISQRGNLSRALDVQRVAAGYYVVRITKGKESSDAGSIIATYPIIIRR